MINEGLILLAMGMGTVFAFLIILILTMNITYKVLCFINKIFPEVVPEVVTTKKQTASNDEEIAIAIAATKAL